MLKKSLNRLSARDAEGNITGHEVPKHDVFELDIVKHVCGLVCMPWYSAARCPSLTHAPTCTPLLLPEDAHNTPLLLALTRAHASSRLSLPTHAHD